MQGVDRNPGRHDAVYPIGLVRPGEDQVVACSNHLRHAETGDVMPAGNDVHGAQLTVDRYTPDENEKPVLVSFLKAIVRPALVTPAGFGSFIQMFGYLRDL